ncbi:hypothetical protein JXO59_06025 [candidate division KSB1 bacterium]|nr:hypothetical protein [candidate division KSB1 bacterium]
METLQIVLVCGALLFIIVIAYRALYKKVVVKEVHSTCKMLVAIRRRGAALDHYLKLGGDEKVDLIHSLGKLCRILHERWLARAQYVSGFSGDVHGLPATAEYDWMIIAIYNVTDYEHFQNCASVLEESQFSPLRYYLEIRLIYGASITDLSTKIPKLF